MAEEPAQPGPDEEAPQSAEEAQGPQPTEEEIRAALDEQMRQVRVEDLLVQSVASLVNLSARRIAKEDERDLAQAKLGIDAVRAVVDLLPDEIAAQVRDALSELQVLYARTASGAEAGAAGGEAESAPAADEQAPEPAAEERPASKLWTPHDRG
jgi:hypothetical protein